MDVPEAKVAQGRITADITFDVRYVSWGQEPEHADSTGDRVYKWRYTPGPVGTLAAKARI